MKILVVDSNADLEVFYRRKLKSISKEVDFCLDTESAKCKINKTAYDLILVSHFLKNTQGNEVYNYIRVLGYSGPIVVVATGKDIQKLRPQYNGIKGLVNKSASDKQFALKVLEVANSDGDHYFDTCKEV